MFSLSKYTCLHLLRKIKIVPLKKTFLLSRSRLIRFHLYSSSQNKVPTAEQKSRSIVAQSENRLHLRATLVAFLKHAHIKIFCHTCHCLFPPALLLPRPNSQFVSWTLILTTILPTSFVDRFTFGSRLLEVAASFSWKTTERIK